ncbi:MAG TPA: protoheme IX farnesyltransferase [Bacteroidales bacterium]|nr:protoheme IX farnesyltransferase [Bacteroidales bacterium]
MGVLKSNLYVVPELWKHRISVMVVFTAVTAYLLAVKTIDTLVLFAVGVGVFLVAGGSASLNHWQERHFDALMQRTRHRPIPSGRVNADFALWLAIGSILVGATVLFVFTGWLPAVLALSNVFWYNAVYTPLKRYTAFAIIPGSIIGAIPALIGWSAAGASLVDIRVWMLGLFLFFWQILHFWILLLKFADDYERAGYASIKRVFPLEDLRWITFPWIMITTVFSLSFPVVGLIRSTAIVWLIVFANIVLIIMFVRYLVGNETTVSQRLREVFLGINFYLLVNMLAVAFQRVVL